MKSTNIGVFDSGFGGIDILRSIVKKMPQYNYVYLGDTARTPYGTRSQETIYEFTRQGVEFLFQNNCNLVILACNTASTVALRRLQQEILPKFYPNKKVLGVLIPAIEETIQTTTTGRIGLLATEATVTSGAFPAQLDKTISYLGLPKNKFKMFSQSAPLLAPIVEALDNHPRAYDLILRDYLKPLVSKKIDTLILGCTHYGILETKIKKILGKKIRIISEGKIVARKLSEYFVRHPEIENDLARDNTVTFYSTDLTDKFNILGSKFFGKKIVTQKATLN